MKKKQERVLSFHPDILENVSVTHGYNITHSFPAHFHTTYNLGIIELGEREIHYRGSKYTLKQDDIFIIQPFEPHSCISKNSPGHSYKIVSFELKSAGYFPHLIIDNRKMLALLREFHENLETQNDSFKLKGLFEQMLSLLVPYLLESKIDTNAQPHITSINIAKQFIEEQCHRELSLKEMADKAFLSEYHFNRCFHKLYGLSPYAYYLVCKMKKAKTVLIKNKSVLKTTYETGFFDQSHFTRLFKKHVGITPGKYLKENGQY